MRTWSSDPPPTAETVEDGGGCLKRAGSAISLVVPDGAELRLSRDKLPPPLHRGQHLHGLIPHLVWFTRRVTMNELANPNELKKNGVAAVIPVVVFSVFPSSFGVRQRGAAIRRMEMNDVLLAQAPLAGRPIHHNAILEQQCCRVSAQGWSFVRHGHGALPKVRAHSARANIARRETSAYARHRVQHLGSAFRFSRRNLLN